MKMDINKIEMQLKESADAKMEMAGNSDEILKIAELIVNCYRSGRKVVLFGNGGSAADAQHLAAEFYCVEHQYIHNDCHSKRL